MQGAAVETVFADVVSCGRCVSARLLRAGPPAFTGVLIASGLVVISTSRCSAKSIRSTVPVYRRAQPFFGKRGGRFGAAEMVALHFIAAERQQRVRLGAGFDAFGNRAHAERLAHGDDGGHDGVVIDVIDHVQHERLVDLQFSGRQALEIGQGRIAGTEIVDGQREPHGTGSAA